MDDQLKREQGVHGSAWNAVHGGYFSDPAIADPLIQAVLQLARRSAADTVVDLGCGTGSLLSLILSSSENPDVNLIGVDASDAQLEIARTSGVSCLQGSVDAFKRQDLGSSSQRLLFMMRSVLHYFGEAGLSRVLRHLRAQIKPGEFFVHQTASFRHVHDADCMNAIYRMMQTHKWYPTVDPLCDALKSEGWRVLKVLPSPSLPLTEQDLARRYHLDPAVCDQIRERFAQDSRVSEDVFKQDEEGFCAYLHYWIYVCTPAVDADR